MSNSRTWLPLAAACAVLALAALIFVVLLQEEGEKPGSSGTTLAARAEERAAASPLEAPPAAREEQRRRVIEEVGTEEDTAFRNKVRFFVVSPDGADRLPNVKVELREQPLPFAFAAALGGGSSPGGGIIQTGVTDSSGSFAFFDVPVREVRYEIRAFHPDYAPASLELPGIPAQGETPEYELRLREGFRLHGRVLAKGTETPLGEARLIVRKANTMAVFLGASSSEPAENDLVVASDGSGYYEVQNAPLGSIEIVVKAKGYAEIRATELLDEAMFPGREKEVDFHLGVGGEIVGRVETQDGSPLAGAEVVARRLENNQSSVVTGRSGADGAFRLEGLIEAEEYFLTGQRQGYISEGQSKAKSGDADVVVHMTPTGRIVGRALRSAGSRPLRQFTATVVSYREIPKEMPPPPAAAGGTPDLIKLGGGNVAGETAGEDEGVASGGNLGFGTLDTSGAESNPAAAPQPARNPYAFYGNSPVIYTELKGTQRMIESRDGSFELDGVVAAGSYVVRIEASGLAPSVSLPFECEKGTLVNIGDILLDAGGELSGIVTDSSGAPVAKATVHVNCAGADPSQNPIEKILGPIGPRPLQRKSTLTDEQGRYAVSMLIPTPVANIVVQKQGFADGDPVESMVKAGEKIEVPPIVLKSGGGVFGVVLQDNVSPKSGMTVSIGPVAQVGGYFRRDAVTGFDGKFEFAGIPAGKYKVHAAGNSTDGNTNPFTRILEIKQSEQEVEVLEGIKSEVTLNIPTSVPTPGIMPIVPQPGTGLPAPGLDPAAQKLKAQTEDEAMRLKKKMQEQQRADEGGGGDGTGGDGSDGD